MTLCDELYFEITVSGEKSELKKFAAFIKSGELDDFFEVDEDYIDYHDEYADTPDGGSSSFVFTNDDLGIEIDEFDTDEFLDVFCRAGRKLDIRGIIYDADDEEYSFVSQSGDSYYLNAKKINVFNDELDAERAREEKEAEED